MYGRVRSYMKLNFYPTHPFNYFNLIQTIHLNLQVGKKPRSPAATKRTMPIMVKVSDNGFRGFQCDHFKQFVF